MIIRAQRTRTAASRDRTSQYTVDSDGRKGFPAMPCFFDTCPSPTKHPLSRA